MALHNMSSSCALVISTNSMLGTITNSSFLTGTYVGKDVLGQFGGMLYAWKFSSKFEKNPQKIMLKSTALQYSGYYMDNASVFVDSSFSLPYLGVSSCIKNISFIGLGAINASNLQKLNPDNISEAYSKVASINTLASSFGMVLGIMAITALPSYTIRSLTLLPILTSISLYSVKKATDIIKLKN
jgi:Vitamin B6 photo-protection and homoeostasis